MADIFVSYASDDRARIKPLVSELERAGYSVWWDQHLKGGTRFSREIESELVGAAVVIVAWSPNSIESRWVADEADLALETGNLLPISFDGTRAPMGFRQLQTVDFSDWTHGEAPCLATLLAALKHHISVGTPQPQHPVSLPAASDTRSDASIAVLPFVNMSADPEQDYFADGIAEELLNLLAKIRELTVIARTSSFTFKGSEKKVSEIGNILGVAHVLEGSVRKAGNRVRITAQLIETRGSSHLWSETYDRTLDDIFAIQDEIAAAIVDELKGLILGGASMTAPTAARTDEMAAYENYLLGQERLNKRTNADIRAAEALFEKALAFDPDYLPALLGLADTLMLQCNVDGFYGSLPIGATCARARPLIERALKLDPASAEAHGMMSLYHRLMGEASAALDCATKALDLNANYSRGHVLMAYALQASGDPAAPIFASRKKALELDPVSPLGLVNVGAEYLNRLRLKEAASYMERILKIDPGSANAHMGHLFIELYGGNYSAAFGRLLKPFIAFDNQTNVFATQVIATSLGYGRHVERAGHVSALRIYAERGLLEDAGRVAKQLSGQELPPGDYQTALALAIWKLREGDNLGALECLAPFKQDEAEWGPDFAMEHYCLGARIAIQALLRQDRADEAAELVERLAQLADIRQSDPEGPHFLADFLSAIAAAARGQIEAALAALEAQLARTLFLSDLCLADPNFADLHQLPRFKALQEKSAHHVEAERKRAEDENLLPIPDTRLAHLSSR